MSEHYYRLYVNHEDTPIIASMQSPEEASYDQERFINEEKYETKEQAKNALTDLRAIAGIPCADPLYPNLQKLKLAAKGKSGVLTKQDQDLMRAIVREELHCIVDEQEQRLDALFNPPEHDGDLGDDASVELREAFQDVRIRHKLSVCAMGIEQVLSLRDWLIQKSPMLERLAKEQEHA